MSAESLSNLLVNVSIAGAPRSRACRRDGSWNSGRAGADALISVLLRDGFRSTGNSIPNAPIKGAGANQGSIQTLRNPLEGVYRIVTPRLGAGAPARDRRRPARQPAADSRGYAPRR